MGPSASEMMRKGFNFFWTFDGPISWVAPRIVPGLAGSERFGFQNSLNEVFESKVSCQIGKYALRAYPNFSS